ncbi:MAG: hypothetical protein AAF561_05170, partial [Planctomycetota bacterium]
EADGHRVLTPQTHPSASIVRRATQIDDFLRKELHSGERVLLVGHSMGGLDCRHLLTHLGGDRYADALLTVATPHHGSAVADFCEKHLEKRAGFYGILGKTGIDIDGAVDLTRAKAEAFNRETPDCPGVCYFSINTQTPVSKMKPFLRPGGGVLTRAEGPNDGLVSAKSGVWGELLTTWPLDHFSTLDKRWRAATTSAAPLWRDAIREVQRRLSD